MNLVPLHAGQGIATAGIAADFDGFMAAVDDLIARRQSMLDGLSPTQRLSATAKIGEIREEQLLLLETSGPEDRAQIAAFHRLAVAACGGIDAAFDAYSSAAVLLYLLRHAELRQRILLGLRARQLRQRAA